MLGYLNNNLARYDVKRYHLHYLNGMIRVRYLPLQGICLLASDLQLQHTWRTFLGKMPPWLSLPHASKRLRLRCLDLSLWFRQNTSLQPRQMPLICLVALASHKDCQIDSR
jgi:hypothetical protein